MFEPIENRSTPTKNHPKPHEEVLDAALPAVQSADLDLLEKMPVTFSRLQTTIMGEVFAVLPARSQAMLALTSKTVKTVVDDRPDLEMHGEPIRKAIAQLKSGNVETVMVVLRENVDKACALRRLDIHGISFDIDGFKILWEFLQKYCLNLQALSLHSNSHSAPLELTGPTTLRVLSLNSMGPTNTVPTEVTSLGALTALTKLDLSGRELSQVANLGNQTALADLRLKSPGLGPVDLRDLTALSRLALYSSELRCVDFSGVTTPRCVDLSNCIWLMQIKGLSSVTALTCLDLSNCCALRDIESLRGLVTLSSLSLSQCRNLNHIDAVESLTRLTNLNLQACRRLYRIDALKGLTALDTLDLTGCTTLTDKEIDAVKSLPGLTHFLL